MNLLLFSVARVSVDKDTLAGYLSPSPSQLSPRSRSRSRPSSTIHSHPTTTTLPTFSNQTNKEGFRILRIASTSGSAPRDSSPKSPDRVDTQPNCQPPPPRRTAYHSSLSPPPTPIPTSALRDLPTSSCPETHIETQTPPHSSSIGSHIPATPKQDFRSCRDRSPHIPHCWS